MATELSDVAEALDNLTRQRKREISRFTPAQYALYKAMSDIEWRHVPAGTKAATILSLVERKILQVQRDPNRLHIPLTCERWSDLVWQYRIAW